MGTMRHAGTAARVVPAAIAICLLGAAVVTALGAQDAGMVVADRATLRQVIPAERRIDWQPGATGQVWDVDGTDPAVAATLLRQRAAAQA